MTEKPLITKYRPTGLDGVVGQGPCVARLKTLVERHHRGEYKMPHLLFTGPPGVGKTTIAEALCHDLFGSDWRGYVKTMNASDERGIDVVRGDIKKFAGSIATGKGFNVIILDEADNLTPDAQGALRMTMEIYSAHCRFIICGNYSNRIIEAIKDRCAYYRFKPLDQGEIAGVISKVAVAEGINLNGAESRIAEAAKGSLRRALNLLSQLPAKPTDADIKAIMPSLDNSIVKNALKSAFAGDIENAERGIMQPIWDGIECGLILEEVATQVMASTLNRKTKLKVMEDVANAEYRVLFGCSPNLQLRALMSSLALMAGDK